MNDEKQVFVVAGIVECDGKFLISQRFSHDRFAPNLWEFPGGKVNFGEDPRRALERELQEELGIRTKVLSIYRIDDHVYSDSKGRVHVILASYRCRFLDGVVQSKQVQDFNWVGPEELCSYNYAAADLEIVAQLARSV